MGNKTIVTFKGFEFAWDARKDGFFTTGEDSNNGFPVEKGVRILDIHKLKAADAKFLAARKKGCRESREA